MFEREQATKSKLIITNLFGIKLLKTDTGILPLPLRTLNKY